MISIAYSLLGIALSDSNFEATENPGALPTRRGPRAHPPASCRSERPGPSQGHPWRPSSVDGQPGLGFVIPESRRGRDRPAGPRCRAVSAPPPGAALTAGPAGVIGPTWTRGDTGRELTAGNADGTTRTAEPGLNRDFASQKCRFCWVSATMRLPLVGRVASVRAANAGGVGVDVRLHARAVTLRPPPRRCAPTLPTRGRVKPVVCLTPR